MARPVVSADAGTAAAGPEQICRRVGPLHLTFVQRAGSGQTQPWAGDAGAWTDAGDPHPSASPDYLVTTRVAERPPAAPPSGALDFLTFDSQTFAFETLRTRGGGAWASGQVWAELPYVPQLGRKDGALHEVWVAVTYADVLRRGGLILHGTTLLLGGQAHVVVGPSGAGKSTLAGRFPGRYLHDELSVVVPDGRGGWQAWRHGIGRAPQGRLPWVVPLASVHVLDPSDRTATRKQSLGILDTTAALTQQTFFAGGRAGPLLLDHVVALAGALPVARLTHDLATPIAEVERTLAEVG